MHQNKTLSGTYRFGLVCGVVAMASIVALTPFSAQAEIKIDPYPKKAMPFAQTVKQSVGDSAVAVEEIAIQ